MTVHIIMCFLRYTKDFLVTRDFYLERQPRAQSKELSTQENKFWILIAPCFSTNSFFNFSV